MFEIKSRQTTLQSHTWQLIETASLRRVFFIFFPNSGQSKLQSGINYSSYEFANNEKTLIASFAVIFN